MKLLPCKEFAIVENSGEISHLDHQPKKLENWLLLGPLYVDVMT